MARPRKASSKPKPKTKEGFQRDERLSGTPALPGQEPLPFEAPGAEGSFEPSFDAVRKGPTPEPPEHPGLTLPSPPPQGCVRVALGCVNADSECSTQFAHSDGCGLFRRHGDPTTPQLPTLKDDAEARKRRMRDIGTCLMSDVRPLLDRACEEREARERGSGPGAIEWNGIAMRRAF